MKKYLLFILLTCCSLFSTAKNYTKDEKTILYLIPFYSNQFNAESTANIKTCEDINQVPSFQLMGFWNGAQLALSEFDSLNFKLNVIVRDVTDNDAKLRAIMEDESLMSKVDLIIGPFFKKQFLIAADYAKKYKIPIVNPFTSRSEILDNNEYVYKLIPSKEIQPAMTLYYAEQFPKYQFIFWADTTQDNEEFENYTSYFDKNAIPYEVVNSYSKIVSRLKKDKHNVIVAMKDRTTQMMMLSNELNSQADLDNLTLIVPETWLESSIYDVEYYSKLNMHFFSHYYIDHNSAEMKDFVDRYEYMFLAPPTLDNFAFQGYDITRFFIELLSHDMDLDYVKISPLAFHLSFDKVKKGGYENVDLQFLEIVNNEIVPANFIKEKKQESSDNN